MFSPSFYFVQLHPGLCINSVFSIFCVVMFIKAVVVGMFWKTQTMTVVQTFFQNFAIFWSFRSKNGDINLHCDLYSSYFADAIIKNKIFCPCIP